MSESHNNPQAIAVDATLEINAREILRVLVGGRFLTPVTKVSEDYSQGYLRQTVDGRDFSQNTNLRRCEEDTARSMQAFVEGVEATNWYVQELDHPSFPGETKVREALDALREAGVYSATLASEGGSLDPTEIDYLEASSPTRAGFFFRYAQLELERVAVLDYFRAGPSLESLIEQRESLAHVAEPDYYDPFLLDTTARLRDAHTRICLQIAKLT